MRNITLTLSFISIITIAFAQSPQSFKYQTVCRDHTGALLVNQMVSFKMSILQDSPSGNVVYSETHQVATNDFGVVNIAIGSGAVVQGNFSSIDWANHSFFVKVDYDRYGQSNYQFMGTSELLSVPFALYANKAKESNKSLNDQDTSSTNEIQTLILNGNQLQISNGNAVTITGVLDLDADPTNEYQQLSINGNDISITNGNTITIPPDADNSPTNELQNLSINGNTVSISNGNSINLSDNSATNELQNLSINGNAISISNGNTINLTDNSATNELQVLSMSNDTIFLSSGGFVVIPSKTPFYLNNSTIDAGGNKQMTIYRNGTVGIGSDATPETSAQLDVNATDKGFLPPRVALQATNNAAPINSPTAGLLIYNTVTAGTAPNNVKPGYYFWNGLKWENLSLQERYTDFLWHHNLNGNPVNIGATHWAPATLGGSAIYIDNTNPNALGAGVCFINGDNQDGYMNWNLTQIDFTKDMEIKLHYYLADDHFRNFSISIGGNAPCANTICNINNGSIKLLVSFINQQGHKMNVYANNSILIDSINYPSNGGGWNYLTLNIKNVREKRILSIYKFELLIDIIDITNWIPLGNYISTGFSSVPPISQNFCSFKYLKMISLEYLDK